jgi:glutamate transport system substrate-binding protein
MAASALAIAACLAGCGGQATASQATFPPGPVTVAIKPDQPGFASGLGVSYPKGFEVGLAYFIGHALGIHISFSPTISSQRDGLIRNQLADMVIATYSITAPRMHFEDFAGPYLKTTQALLVRGHDNHFKSQADVRHQHICTVKGSTPSQYYLPGASVTQDSLYTQCVTGLLNHKFAAVFTDTLILYGYEQAHKGRVKVVLAGKIGLNQYYGVALPPHHHALCQKIDQAIQQFINTQWTTDFNAYFPDAVAAYPGSWQSVFGVTPADIAAQSCQS